MKKPVFNYAPGSDRLTNRFLFEAADLGYSSEEWRNKGPAEAFPTTKLKMTTGKSKYLFKFAQKKDADFFHDTFDSLVRQITTGKRIMAEKKNPMPNYHSARLESPRKYRHFAYGKNLFGKGIDAVYGFTTRKAFEAHRPRQGGRIQAIRFDARRYSPEKARAWLKDRPQFRAIKFEPARKNPSAKLKKYSVILSNNKKGIAERTKIINVHAANKKEAEYRAFFTPEGRSFSSVHGTPSTKILNIEPTRKNPRKRKTLKPYTMSTMSYQKAKAAAMDAANRQMKANRRDAWNADDYNLACRTLARLCPSCGADPRAGYAKNPFYQPSIIKYPTGKYSYVGSLPESLCDMSDRLYPKPLKFDTFQDALNYAIKQGFKKDPKNKYGLLKKKNPGGNIGLPRPENYNYFPQYFNDLETYLGTKLSSTRKKEEEQRYQKSWINRWQNYGKAMRTMKNPVRRKNQQSIYDRTAERRAEGQRRAKTTEPAIYAQWRKQDRYQASHFLWNMIKALKISPWQNTIDDWQRYFEAKYILKLRKSRR